MTRGSVWWVDFDPATGSEIQKIRPAVIVSNDRANAILSRVIVVPMTSNVTKLYPGNASVTVGTIHGRVMADQIMAADKVRLKKKIGTLSAADLQDVDNALYKQLDL
jgi:mRNA interferase MazF